MDVDHNEIARIKRLQKQMREREALRFANPDAEPELEWIWVAHVWVPNNPKDVSVGEWVFAGFRRRRNRRKPQSMNGFFAKVRRKFGIDKRSPVVMRDLQSVARLVRSKDQAWRTRPPQFQERRVKPKGIAPVPVGVKTKRRAAKWAYKLDRRSTKFIALGRNPWDRKPGYLYCGPLEADYRSDAVREADRLFRGMHQEILIVKTSELSKPLRNRMHSGKRVKAGVARILWPEPVPEFDLLWAKLVKHGKAQEKDSDQYHDVKRIWFEADCPWLSLGWMRKQIKTLTPSIGDEPCAAPKARKRKATSAPLPPRKSARRTRPAAMRAASPHRRAIRMSR